MEENYAVEKQIFSQQARLARLGMKNKECDLYQNYTQIG